MQNIFKAIAILLLVLAMLFIGFSIIIGLIIIIIVWKIDFFKKLIFRR